MLTHVSLFAGIGGDTLASEWAGFETVLLCEIDKFCQRVLEKNFPGVPIIGDVRDVTREVVANAYRERCIHGESEVISTERGEYAQCNSASSLTLLTAGVPCQPASQAGKRRGKKDDRWLWPEAIRVLRELQPTWCVFENPAGIGSLGELGSLSEMDDEAYQELPDREAVELTNIINDIEKEGYEVQPVCIPACAVGAPHRRDRIFIIAHSEKLYSDGSDHNIGKCLYHEQISELGDSNRESLATYTKSIGLRGCASEKCGVQERQLVKGEQRGCEVRNQVEGCIDFATDCESEGRERQQRGESDKTRIGTRLSGDEKPDWSENWIAVASRLCSLDARVSDNLARPDRDKNRVQKLKACGNAIVPAQIYPILKAIADIERNIQAVLGE